MPQPRLRLARTIRATLYAELDPPNDDQVQAYLSSSFEALSAVREALETERSWWKLLRSPLMLNIIYYAFGEYPARPSQAWSARDVFGRGSDEQRQGRIFDAYVDRMLTYRTTSYTAQQTIGWLTWLARTLTRQGEETLYVERLQPEILADSAAERKVRNIVVPARILLGVGMSFVWLFVSGLPVPWAVVILIIIAGTVGPITSARKNETERAGHPSCGPH